MLLFLTGADPAGPIPSRAALASRSGGGASCLLGPAGAGRRKVQQHVGKPSLDRGRVGLARLHQRRKAVAESPVAVLYARLRLNDMLKNRA